MKLRQVILASAQFELIAQLLSEVLEWPLTPLGDGVRVGDEEKGALLFIRGKRGVVNDASMIDFSVESREELNQLYQRWEFVRYRHGVHACKQGQFVDTDSSCYFLVHDPDGRKWKFSFVKSVT